MRSAIVRAASRRGWVWPMFSRPISKAILGSCVVLPEPVSPATITTWLSRMARPISSRFWLTGSSGGKWRRAGETVEDMSLPFYRGHAPASGTRLHRGTRTGAFLREAAVP